MGTYFSKASCGQRRFWYLDGLTSDEFYLEDGMKTDLNWLIQKELKENGYEKIIFYDTVKRLYCYDDHSFALLRPGAVPPETASAVQPAAPRRGRGLRKGGWDKKKTEVTAAPIPKQASASGTQSGVLMTKQKTHALHVGMQADTAILSQFEAMMKDNSHPAAIVIDDADNFLTELAVTPRWKTFLNNVVKLPAENVNIMLFIFPDREGGSILQMEALTKDEEMQRNLNTIPVMAPNALEYCNMLHHFRLMHGLKVRVSEIPETAREISRCIAKIAQENTGSTGIAQGVRIKMLYHFLMDFAQSGKMLTPDNCYQLFSAYHMKPIPTAAQQLQSMIGMKSVKQQIVEKFKGINAEKRLWMQLEAESRIKPAPEKKDQKGFMHIVLTGNPGTGKTTVARLLGQFFSEAGYLRTGHVVETDRSGLVAGYVGQTAIKTRDMVRRALGGVLFIDEAYAIIQDEHDTFGKECLDTLIKAMDEFRHDLIVVVAGYPEPMENFLKANEGMSRRIREKIYIPDYTPEELLQILHLHMQRKHLRFSDEMQPRMLNFCENWIASADEHWGNAGEAVQLAEDLETAAVNLSDTSKITDKTTGEVYSVIEERHISEKYRDFLRPAEEIRGDAVEDIMNMPGLKHVKKKIREIENALIAGNQGETGHYVFMGAPGTGKTTVARKMGMLFRSHGLLKRGHLVETNAGELISEMLHHPDFDRVGKKALDGVLFIDEAYQLMNTANGRDIIDSLVKYMEDHRDRLCVILAGYEDQMSEMLRTANPGLASRTERGRIYFDNYTGEELYQIFCRMLPESGMNASEEFLELSHHAIVGYMKTQEKNRMFGNARYIRDSYLEDAKAHMNARLVSIYGREIPEAERNLLTGADIPESLERFARQPLPEQDNRPLLEQLDDVVGFDSIKEHLRQLLRMAEFQKQDASGGMPLALNLNMVLKGNPGTGKTMIANLIGKVYKECGLLPEGRTLKVDRSDLVAGYVGQTAIRTQNWIEKAMGNVLFIDEAYALTDSGSEHDFGSEAVTTLVAAMTDHMGEFAVIAAGYPDKMDKFLRSNAGLNRRFEEFLIADYTAEELAQIFRNMCRKMKFQIEPSLDRKLVMFFSQFKTQKSKTEDWQNAGECETLCRNMQMQWLRNPVTHKGENGETQNWFTEEHVPEEMRKFLRGTVKKEKTEPSALQQIREMTGFPELKEYFAELLETVHAVQETGRESLLDDMSLHMVLTGNPGTGKTTVARLIGNAYKELGLLKTGNLVKVTRGDLVAGYVGQTALKTKGKIREALNGVLFIDEAYMLTQGGKDGFGQEAFDTILEAMSDLDGQFAVVAAGYPREMEQFLASNPGMRSRFKGNEFYMPDYTNEQLIAIFRQKCSKAGAVPSDALTALLPALLDAMRSEQKRRKQPWANGREMEQLEQNLRKRWTKFRNMTEQDGETFLLYTPEMLPDKYQALLEQQHGTEPAAFRLPSTVLPKAGFSYHYPEDTAETEKGVVLIECTASGETGYGSGTMLTHDGYILTCSHVIRNAEKIRVRLKIAGRTDGEISWHEAKKVRDDPEMDAALLKIELMGYPALPVAPPEETVHPADGIFLLGYPFGAMISDSVDALSLSHFEGKIASVQVQNGLERIFVNMEAKSGCSGAPVFSQETGNIIGILCGSATSANGRLVEELNFILPVKHIRERFFR